MPSAFGMVYALVRPGFVIMLTIVTLAGARLIIWPRLVEQWAPPPPAATAVGKPEAALRPWLWCDPGEAVHRRQRVVGTVFSVVVLLAVVGMLLGNHDSDTVEPPSGRVVLYNLWGSVVVMFGAIALADVLATGCALVVAARGGAGGAGARGLVRGVRARWSWVLTSRQRSAAAFSMWLLFSLLGLHSGYYVGEATPTVRNLDIPITNLPQCLDGYRVGMISDVHAGERLFATV